VWLICDTGARSLKPLLDWLANHLTYPMLKRWMLIWLTVVIIGVFSLFPEQTRQPVL
jgi:hypothetical protein